MVEYFRYDTASEYRDAIQADQLAGQWYANMTGLGDLVPREMQHSALKKIYAFNVMKFGNGEMGAVNGMTSDGSIMRQRTGAKKCGSALVSPCRPAAERRDAATKPIIRRGVYTT